MEPQQDNMSVIILKGTDRKLECTISQCGQINKMKESKSDPKTPLNISGVVVELGDIKYAINDGETDKGLVRSERDKENDKHYAELNDKYNLFIKDRCFSSPEVKSKSIVLFETLFLGVTDKKLNDVQKAYIEKMQLDYFNLNPRHPYAKVDYFKLLKDLPENRDDFNMEYHIGSSALRLVQKVIGEAFITSYQLDYIK